MYGNEEFARQSSAFTINRPQFVTSPETSTSKSASALQSVMNQPQRVTSVKKETAANIHIDEYSDSSESDFSSETYETIRDHNRNQDAPPIVGTRPVRKSYVRSSDIVNGSLKERAYKDVVLSRDVNMIVYSILVIHVAVFLVLMLVRNNFQHIGKTQTNATTNVSLIRIDSITLIFAKNAAVMTVISTYLCLIIVGYVLNREGCLFLLIHRLSAYMLIFFSLIHTIAHVVRYFIVVNYVYTFREMMFTSLFVKYVSGIFMLIFALVLIGSATNWVRKYHYNAFYYLHNIGAVGFLLSACIHSWWFCPIVVFWFVCTYLHRLVCRYFVKCSVSVKMYSKEFVMLDIIIKRTFLSKILILRSLERNNGNSDIWLICNNLSRFERHPFTVIDTNRRGDHSYVSVMLSKFGDWKMKLCNLLETNRPYNLYSCGINMSIDKTHISMPCGPWKSKYLLFLMNNVEYTTFLAFITHLCDTRHQKIRGILRKIYLHYSFSDYGYYQVMLQHLSRAQMYDMIHLQVTVYTSLTVPQKDITPNVRVVQNATCRLPYRQAVDKFYQDSMADNSSRTIVINNPLLRAKVIRYVNESRESYKSRKQKTIQVV